MEVAPLAPPKAGGSFRAYFEAVLEFVRRRKIDFVVVGAGLTRLPATARVESLDYFPA